MPTHASFDYAVIRFVPRVEREEFMNVGLILFCRTKRFLEVRLSFSEARLRSFAPDMEMENVLTHLSFLPRVAAGGKESGPIGALPQPERFYWLVAPRSTIIQASPVHTGLCTDPAAEISRLMTWYGFDKNTEG